VAVELRKPEVQDHQSWHEILLPGLTLAEIIEGGLSVPDPVYLIGEAQPLKGPHDQHGVGFVVLYQQYGEGVLRPPDASTTQVFAHLLSTSK